MKKSIKAFWKGIKAVFTAVVEWTATLFGMNDNSKYGRVLRRVVGIAFAVVIIVWAGMWIYRFGSFLIRDLDIDWGEDHAYFSEQVSDDISYYDGYYGHYGYLKNARGKKVLKHIQCINKPLEGDSLVYFSDGEKRGYFHMRDGHVVVKPIYEHAWIFSDGLAAVAENRRIKFINTEGQVVIDSGFAYDEGNDGYVFHQGHCAVNDSTGKRMGLIDRNGQWVLPPVYESIYPIDTFWLVCTGDAHAVFTFGMDTVFPLTKGWIEISDTAIFVTYADHTQNLYTRKGELITANMIRDVEQLMYETDEVEYPIITSSEYNDSYSVNAPYTRKAVATCWRYEAECGWYGLMSSDGKQVTPPLYQSIEAVDKDLYLCETSYGHGVILNSKGQRVR